MFVRFHAMREERDERGFTLIELLVVILIIAILAAIAIPVFLRQREKGWVSQQESSLKNAATAAETIATENNGSYATVSLTTLMAAGFQDPSYSTVTASGDATSFCIQSVHEQEPKVGTTSWKTARYSSAAGRPESGGCTATE
jgi:type IV pilus assembly protein PilA